MSPIILVHGGAWAIPDEACQAHQEGVERAAAAGWKALERGASSLDAVEEAVATLEDNETFDAGRGAFLNRDGRVQLDALIMDGASLKAGGVGCVERLLNPVRAARVVLEKSPHIYFVADGAERFASEHGISLIENSDLVLPREIERWKNAAEQRYLSVPAEFSGKLDSHDTVGAVALDCRGNIAAATSTGGTLNKAPGRVGDSSLIGCGCYADNETAAASTTGWGEPMMKLVFAKWATDHVTEERDPAQVAPESIGYLQRRLDGFGGIILLDRKGRIGMAHNTPRMAWAWRNESHGESGLRSQAR
ncbi:MAG TPA: isoaspartyl peptidase/L-asparaginase [Candidatus Saccharimonadales bacterium]|nr:isoaspartyl peptidase/L-asparaginase [Candidatus Saccharimonadales bacterium]